MCTYWLDGKDRPVFDARCQYIADTITIYYITLENVDVVGKERAFSNCLRKTILLFGFRFLKKNKH